MEEIEKRLRDTTDACIKSFENWIKQEKNLEARETLMETIHEVRKVVSRLEVEIAISERDRLGSRPLPIPPHRSSKKNPQAGDDFGDDDAQPDFAGSMQPPRGGDNNNRPRGPHRGRRPMGAGGRSGGGNNGNGNGNEGGNDSSDSQPQ